MKKQKQLTSDEWTLLWSSMRYFMGRMSIAAADFPRILMNYYDRLTEDQMDMLFEELSAYARENEYFGMKNVDHPRWLKLMNALDFRSHFNILATTGEVIRVFECNDRIYPLDKYKLEPEREISVVEEYIVKEYV